MAGGTKRILGSAIAVCQLQVTQPTLLSDRVPSSS